MLRSPTLPSSWPPILSLEILALSAFDLHGHFLRAKSKNQRPPLLMLMISFGLDTSSAYYLRKDSYLLEIMWLTRETFKWPQSQVAIRLSMSTPYCCGPLARRWFLEAQTTEKSLASGHNRVHSSSCYFFAPVPFWQGRQNDAMTLSVSDVQM